MSAPTAGMGFQAYWQAMDGLSVYKDAGITLCANGETCQQLNESLGIVAGSNLSQAIAGDRPTFQTGGAGGKSRLFFDGAGDQLANAVAINNYMAIGASTIVMALTVPVGYTPGGTILTDVGGWFDINHLAGNILRYRVWDTAYRSVDAAFTPGTALVVTYKHELGSLYSKVNNGAWSAGVVCGNRGGSTALLLNSGVGDANIYALALANVALTDANVTAVVNYLKAQLGIP